LITQRINYAVFTSLACVGLILASCRSTEQGKNVEPKKLQTQKPAAVQAGIEKWNPPTPAPDDFDWIRHKSGEWLKGDIDLLRYGTLQFDSDKMGEREFDFEDIIELRSPRMNTCLFEGDIDMVGTLLMRDGYVKVGGEEGRCFERAKLQTILPGEPKESSFWKGELTLGVSTRSGNTDLTTINGSIDIERRTLATLIGLDYAGNYGKLEGEENINNHRLLGQYQVFLTDRLYLSPVVLEAYKDEFQNIDYRMTPAAGVGYFIFDQGDLKWNVDALGGFQYTRFDSVTAGEDRSDTTSAVIALSKFETDLTKDVDLELEYSITYPLTSDISPNHHANAGISIELNDTLNLDLAFTWDRVGNPERDSGGELPEKDDYRLTVGLGVEF
jgi:hypothetical protein